MSWRLVVSSADGSLLVAAEDGSISDAAIYTSSNGGRGEGTLICLAVVE